MDFDIGSALAGGFGLLSNAFNNRQIQENNERALQFQKYQYEDSKRWNSVTEQVKRLRAAGINPAFALGAVTPGFASSVSAPGFNSPQSLDVGGIASALQGAYTNIPQSELSESQKLLNNANQRQVEFDNQLNQIFGHKQRSAEIDKIIQEASKYHEEAVLAQVQGDTEKSQQALNKSMQLLNQAKKALTDSEKVRIDKINLREAARWDIEQRTGEATIKKLRSGAAADYATAEEARANASYTRYEESFQRALEANNLDQAISIGNKMFNEELISKAQLDQVRAAAALAQNAADHAEALFWKDYCLDLLGGLVDVGTSIFNAKSFRNLSKSSQQRVKNQLEEIQLQYGDQMEVNDTWNGKKRTRRYRTKRRQYD